MPTALPSPPHAAEPMLPDVDRTGSDGADAPSLLVELLASRWPDLRARLLLEHTDDGNGRCTGCRVPGYGTPGGHWPCLLATLAQWAEQRAATNNGKAHR